MHRNGSPVTDDEIPREIRSALLEYNESKSDGVDEYKFFVCYLGCSKTLK
jgi:hypothetical protein